MTRIPVGGRSLLSLAYLAAGGANLLFHLAAVHSATPPSYGAFGVATALIAIVTIPLGAVEVAVAAAVARAGGRIGLDATLARYRRLVSRPCLVAAGVAAVVSTAVLSLNPVEGLLVAGFLVVAVVMTLGRALLIGSRHYSAAAISVLAAPGTRLAGLLLLATAGLAANAASLLALTVAGEAVAAVVVLYATHRRLPAAGAGVDVTGGDLLVACAALAAVAVLGGADVLLGRVALAPSEGGRLAAVANLSRAALYVPQAIAFATLPDLASGSGRRAVVVVRRAAAGLAVLTAVAVAGLLVLGEPVAGLLVGDRAAGVWLPGLIVAAAGAGIVHLTVTALLARRSGWALYALLAVPAVGLAPLIDTVAGIIAAAATTTLVAAVVGLALLGRAVGAQPAVADGEQRAGRTRVGSSLSVVVPAYRPGPRFEQHLTAVAAVVDRLSGGQGEVVVVDDGCPEQAGQRARAVAARIPGATTVTVIAGPTNRGKGHALRTGISATSGEVVAYIDADGDISADHLADMLERLIATDADVVVGDKVHPGSCSDGGRLRRALTFGYGTLVQLLFGLDVIDTQVGCKVWRGPLLRSAAATAVEDGFAIDLELLVGAQRAAERPLRVVSAPVRIARGTGPSTVRLASTLDALTATVRLRARRTAAPVAAIPAAQPAPTLSEAA